MTNIALISLHTPTVNNYRGASALPYHLMLFRPEDVDIEVWSFNINDCGAEQIKKTEDKLGIKIHIIPRPKWLSQLSFPLIRLLLPKPILGYLRIPDRIKTEINSFLQREKPAVWVYGEDISDLAKSFGGLPIVITTPDCEAMYYYRVLEMAGVPLGKLSLVRYTLMYHRYAKFASNYPTGRNIKYHLVGEADASFLKRLNPRVNTFFIRHPHYDIKRQEKAPIAANEPIKMLVAGRYDFYMSRAVDEAIAAMASLPDSVKNRFQVTFLGKDWETSCNELTKVGYKAEIKKYVDDYASELSLHHIQLTPIVVGTGTKGKVLDAFANGLLVIGTPLALENIAVESGKDCVRYSTQEQLMAWLNELSQHPATIMEMAHSGQKAVLDSHSRKKIATEFFRLFN